VLAGVGEVWNARGVLARGPVCKEQIPQHRGKVGAV
jgi:hypothetical protein